ncbi:unnamed protein product [Urochloa humidicola]
MALQNIGASNKDDAFYRYKMPRMVRKTEGRGNGIRTKIENIADIAKALDRPASYITKYFGYELGAKTKFEQRTSSVNGAHDTVKLAGLLDNFINKFVQCYGCGNPETKILISDTPMVSLKCAACGFVSGVTDDKLTKFIKTTEQKGGKDTKVMQRAAKGGGNKSSDEDYSTSPCCCQDGGNVGAADDDDGDVQWQTDTSLEAVKQRMKEQLSSVTAELVTLSLDGSEKKQRKQKDSSHKVYGSTKPLDNYDKIEMTVKANPYKELVEEIKANLGNAVTAAQLKKVLCSSALPSQDVMNALLEALFDGVGKGFNEEVMKNKEYLAAAVPDEGSQTLLLVAIEVFGSKCSAMALKEIPFVLRTLYYGDVLEEDAILNWYNVAVASGKNSEVLQIAKPFVECLQSADYESDEEE